MPSLTLFNLNLAQALSTTSIALSGSFLSDINLEAYSTTKAFVDAYINGRIPQFNEVYDSNAAFWSEWSAPDNVIYFSDSNYAAILEEKSNLESLINTNG